jgi:hypothetical protein
MFRLLKSKKHDTPMKLRYKFLKEGLKSHSGNEEFKLGEWKKHEDIEMCQKGFHCSKKICQAFSYVQESVLAQVEVKGKHQSQDDKEVWSEMRIVKAWKWQKKDSVAIAIFAAELCLKNFEEVYPNDKRPREAIEAAKKWLENPTIENKSAAWSAARAAWAVWSAERAAESAARAAWSAAWSAESAAESAAWAAWSAARAAAEKSTLKKIYKRFDEQLKQLEELK